MTILYIPNPAQYLNLTTTLLTINKQQIRSLSRIKVVVNGLLIAKIEPKLVRIGVTKKTFANSI